MVGYHTWQDQGKQAWFDRILMPIISLHKNEFFCLLKEIWHLATASITSLRSEMCDEFEQILLVKETRIFLLCFCASTIYVLIAPERENI